MRDYDAWATGGSRTSCQHCGRRGRQVDFAFGCERCGEVIEEAQHGVRLLFACCWAADAGFDYWNAPGLSSDWNAGFAYLWDGYDSDDLLNIDEDEVWSDTQSAEPSHCIVNARQWWCDRSMQRVIDAEDAHIDAMIAAWRQRIPGAL